MVSNQQDPEWETRKRMRHAQKFTSDSLHKLPGSNNYVFDKVDKKTGQGSRSKLVPRHYVAEIKHLQDWIADIREPSTLHGLSKEKKQYFYSLASYLNQLRLNFWNELPGHMPGPEWRASSLHQYLCRQKLQCGHDDEERKRYTTLRWNVGKVPYSENPLSMQQEVTTETENGIIIIKTENNGDDVDGDPIIKTEPANKGQGKTKDKAKSTKKPSKKIMKDHDRKKAQHDIVMAHKRSTKT
ncbi:hypothetical protein FRC03_011385 [Tulasnella sp. 419]|nr:hypothetical protein FRC03_011385 [Tulasnella sp. 419]